MIRIDEQSLELVYLNRYKLRKKELIQLVEKLVRLKLFPLEDENKRLKENIHSMLFTDDFIQKRYEKASEENSILREQLDVKNGMIDNLITENDKLKKLLNEIDVVYSSGINKRENKCDEYVIYQSTFTKLDELFYKWEKMREVVDDNK